MQRIAYPNTSQLVLEILSADSTTESSTFCSHIMVFIAAGCSVLWWNLSVTFAWTKSWNSLTLKALNRCCVAFTSISKTFKICCWFQTKWNTLWIYWFMFTFHEHQRGCKRIIHTGADEQSRRQCCQCNVRKLGPVLMRWGDGTVCVEHSIV